MKFSVKNIGKISQADFEIKPLTIFIGQNDSGKTYAASSFWAIVNFLMNDFRLSIRLDHEVKDMISSAILESFSTSKKSIKHFSQDELLAVRSEIDTSLKENSIKILEDCFKFKGFTKNSLMSLSLEGIYSLSIAITVLPEVVNIAESDSESDDKYRIDIEVSLKDGEQRKTVTRLQVNDVAEDSAKGGFINFVIKQEVSRLLVGYAYFGEAWEKVKNISYIPAARTGIMLALNYFVEGSINKLSLLMKNKDKKIREDDEITSNLTAPLASFAEVMQRRSLFNMGSSTANNGLLSKLLSGRISKVKDAGNFTYQPRGIDIPIPLAAASSMVTEIAPLSIMQTSLQNSFVIFEEPEAHLHLAAQREMAKVIVQLVNSGCNLLVTTHSDTFLQQLNNLLLLGDHPKKRQLLEKFNLSEDDTLSPDKVSAYDFECDEGSTTVKKMKFSEWGFVAESLNKVLINLADQSHEIIETLRAEDDDIEAWDDEK